MISIYDHSYDYVIKSHYVTGHILYKDALDWLYPSIDSLDMQRERQSKKFYSRLAEDIKLGCIMPPITVALIDRTLSLNSHSSREEIDKRIQDGISEYFVLDGIQRLNTLYRVSQEHDINFESIKDRKLHLNIILCSSYDLLLYRMITLNNGQRPMSARHQLEIIAANIFDFEGLGLDIQTEKRKPNTRRKQGAFKKGDIIKGYLAFLSASVNIDNSKIIESKMDEILARRVVDSNIVSADRSFEDLADFILRVSDYSSDLKKWFQQPNNLIGFCAGARKAPPTLFEADPEVFNSWVETFESAFQNIDISRIKVGMARRTSLENYFANFEEYKELDELDLTYEISAVI